jgi:hypothetical protein
MRSIGLPELIVVLLVLVLPIIIIVAVSVRRGGGRPRVSGQRLCPSCGQALVQPQEARFCRFCGRQIP